MLSNLSFISFVYSLLTDRSQQILRATRHFVHVWLRRDGLEDPYPKTSCHAYLTNVWALLGITHNVWEPVHADAYTGRKSGRCSWLPLTLRLTTFLCLYMALVPLFVAAIFS